MKRAVAGRFDGRVVIVGGSLAGLRAAEALRDEGFAGPLTVIGDEPHEPYDRPPLSKRVLAGRMPAGHTTLPRLRETGATWLLGVAGVRLDRALRQVHLDDGRRVDYDRVLIATGTRARPWPDPAAARLDGVFTLRTCDDAARLEARLAAGPRRVLVIGAGFTGSEVASVCRERGLAVTVVERGPGPLTAALGTAAATLAAQLQRDHGVDLRCHTTVQALEGERGRLRRARLSDGQTLEVDVAVVALGAVRNTEWLQGSGLAADGRGVVCDGACRAFDVDAIVTGDVLVAGDVARWPHPLYDGQFIAVEHWGNAVEQARTAAHNLARPDELRVHRPLPAFWSNQFGLNLKVVGLPALADQVVLMQGSVDARRLVAAFGREGRTVAAIAVDAPRWLDAYAALIEARAPFPPRLHAADGPAVLTPLPADHPRPREVTHASDAMPAGPGPLTPARADEEPLDPRLPEHPTF